MGEEVVRLIDLTKMNPLFSGDVIGLNRVSLTIKKVEYPYTLKYRKQDTLGSVLNYLSLVDIDEDLGKHKPSELSGGQQQRIVIARALVNNPKILLGDDPTGNFDSKTGTLVMKIQKKLNQKGETLIIVTHDPGIAAQADCIFTIHAGRVLAS